jgi:hypothetical protein
MFLRPFRDFSGRAEHALHERAVALEMEMFDAALAGMGGQANRQDEIDEVHLQHLCFERLERSIGHLKPFGSEQDRQLFGFPWCRWKAVW